MNISELCIKRPVFATVLTLVLVLIGIISYQRLTVREYPKIDEPVVTVETRYPGASAEIMETQISKILEDSLAGIEGIEVMSSISRAENSQVVVRFNADRDQDDAANDVRDRVGRVRSLLPDEVEEPVVAKVEADAQPIIYLAFFSDRHDPMEISDYADRYVKDRLQNISGVADVRIIGERRVSMRIWLNSARLAAYGVTPQDVENALRAQNVEIPAGRIESKTREFTVLSETDLKTKEQFENVIIKRNGDEFVRIRDVGHAELAPEDVRRVARYRGQTAVALGVVKQSVANPLDVSKRLYEIIPEISATLPAGMKLDVAYDTSVFIDRSIKNVYHTIFEAMILVIAVIYLFLRSVRSTFIPMVTIPVSLIGAFAMMYAFGFSINTLTLLALVLAIGMVVDDAIVMLENIYRYVEEGMDPIEAAKKGSREISFAVIAMTITLAAVYAPVAFLTGTTGKLFTEFALTLAGAVIISGFVALTLSPMMCSRLLRHETNYGPFMQKVGRFHEGMGNWYKSVLDWSLAHMGRVVWIGLGVAAFGGVLFFLLKAELAPVEDRGTIVTIAIAPEGATIDYTANWMQKLEPIYEKVPEIEKYFVIGGFPTVSQGIAFTRLKDWADRSRSQQDVIGELMGPIFSLPGILAFPVSPPSLGRSARSQPVEFVIQTTGSYEELNDVVGQIVTEATKSGKLINVDTDLKLNKPQLSIDINRDKAAAIGVDIDTVGRTMETLLGGRQVTRFKKEGEQYDVIVQIADQDRTTPEALDDIYIRNNQGEMIKLSNIVSSQETVAPRELNHFNQMRAAKISGSIMPGSSLGEVLELLTAKAQEIMPASMRIDYDGESREFKKSSSSLWVTFILALMFIYLVMAAQFESFASPMVILLTVPLSMTGALFTLFVTGNTLSIYSQVGLITLIGLITKNGILIVEFANQLRDRGMRIIEAAHQSALLRFRPILMTAIAMILGAVPLALSSGAGAESRAQIGWTIIGGMTIGTFFSLFVIPVAYILFMRFRRDKLGKATH